MASKPWSLPAAFDLVSGSGLVAVVGGGGKTSLLFALAKTLPGKVVITTTTRIFAAQMSLATAVVQFNHKGAKDTKKTGMKDEFGAEMSRLLAQYDSCLVVGEVVGDKAYGVPPELPGQLLARPDVDFVLVEADGSRMRPIKAPAEHEPVIPPESTLVVPVVGIDALDSALGEIAHRPEIAARILTLAPEDIDHYSLDAADIATLLIDQTGGLKAVPPNAEVIVLINKVETAVQLQSAYKIAHYVLQQSRIKRVIIAALKKDQPVRAVVRRVTAVVLAAGQSVRMGRTKQLLPWGDTTILGQVLRNLKGSAVYDILVVSGHEAEKIEALAAVEDIAAIRNTQYAIGEMLSSLQTAVVQLPPYIDAVLVMLADQPQITPDIIDQLLHVYWQGQAKLIAPSFEGKRGNPVLIDRAHFVELLALPAGAAPRDLLKRHPARLVPLDSDTILLDLDEWERYVGERPSLE